MSEGGGTKAGMSKSQLVLLRKQLREAGKTEVLSSTAGKTEVLSKKKGSEFLDGYFGDADIKPEEGMNDMYKANVLLQQGGRKSIKEVVNSRSQDDVCIRLGFDGTSRGVLGCGEFGREVWRGSKWVVTEASCNWGHAFSDERGEAFFPMHTVLYPPGKKKKKGPAVEGTSPKDNDTNFAPPSPQPCSEGFDVASLLAEQLGIDDLISKMPPGKVLVIDPVTDSGGSTQNQQIFFRSLLMAGPNSNRYIVWGRRCMVHHAAIAGRDSSRLFLSCAGVNARNWEKKVHLQAHI